MENKKRSQEENRDDEVDYEIRCLFSGCLQMYSCRKRHSVVFGKCEILMGLWVAYTEVFICMYTDYNLYVYSYKIL